MSDPIHNIKNTLLRSDSIYRAYQWKGAFIRDRRRPAELAMIYQPADLTPEYYQKAKASGDRELEHQIGRLVNFKQIINEWHSLPGHLVEFGTYRGFSMLWIAYLYERLGVFNKKFIGIDSFTGLPYNDGVWRKSGFSAITLKQCRNFIHNSRQLYSQTKQNIFIEQALFKDQNHMRRIFNQHDVSQLSFIHVDCDVSQSFVDIAELLDKYDLIAPQAYILFDDYGQPSNMKSTVDKVIERWRNKFTITEHSATKFTKNFKLVVK